MIRKMRLALIMIGLLCAAVCVQGASMTAPAGYGCFDTAFSMPAGASFGGFDILPNGNFAIHDGYSLREIDKSGTDIRTLYSYSGFVYGSFVKYNSADGRIYFGDSSSASSRILSVALDGTGAGLLTTLKWNYDLDFQNGVPYVAASDSIYRVDSATGDAVQIAQPGIVSGPLAFDAAGSLYYGTGEWGWPPASNGQNILRWTAAEVAAADGENMLAVDSAHTYAADVDGPSNFAFRNGVLFYSDAIANPGEVRFTDGVNHSVFSQCVNVGYDPTTIHYDAATDSTYVAVTWFDEFYNKHAVITTIAVPEPSSIVALCSFVGLAASPRLLRRRGR